MNTEETQEIKINSLQELKITIEKAKMAEFSSKSQAINTTLDLQLRVINLINKSTLVDSSFDLIFADFKKALVQSNDNYERDLIKEKIKLYIHNYIFFLDAKLAYMFKKDEQITEELVQEAVKSFAQHSIDLVQLAYGDPKSRIIAGKNLISEFTKKIMDNPNLIKKIMHWYNKEEKQLQAKSNFHQTLDYLFIKLEYYKTDLGSCDIIYSLLQRWKSDVVDYRISGFRISFTGLLLGLAISLISFIFILEFILNIDVYNILKLSVSKKILLMLIFIVVSIISSGISTKFIKKIKEYKRIDNLIKFYSNKP